MHRLPLVDGARASIQFDRIMHKPIYVVVGTLILCLYVFLGWKAHISSHPVRDSYAQRINALNAELPANLDHNLRVESVSLDWPGREIRYVYTLTRFDAADFDKAQFAKSTLMDLKRSLCQQNVRALQGSSNDNVRMRHSYVGRDGLPIASLVVDPGDCVRAHDSLGGSQRHP